MNAIRQFGAELDSLKALLDVSTCVLRMKWDESVPSTR